MGEGFVGRRIGVVIEKTLWAREGTPQIDYRASVKTTDGWLADDGALIPYKDVGSHRAEVGDRLLVGLFKDSDFGFGWTLFTSGVPIGSDGVVKRDADQGGLALKINRMSMSHSRMRFVVLSPIPLSSDTGVDPLSLTP